MMPRSCKLLVGKPRGLTGREVEVTADEAAARKQTARTLGALEFVHDLACRSASFSRDTTFLTTK